MKLQVHGDCLYGWLAAAVLAECGHQVRLDAPADSPWPGREPGLALLVRAQRDAGRLRCRGESDTIAMDQMVHILTDEHDISLTLQTIRDHAREDVIAAVMATLPVGVLDALQQEVNRQAGAGRLHLVGLPLFVRSGAAIADFRRPSLLLISGVPQSPPVMTVLELMRPVARRAEHVMIVSHAAAGLIKMGITAMLAMRVSFINEMAALSEKLGVDVEVVREGLSADPRIGGAYLQPGCGFGGPSFSRDLLSYSRTLQQQLEVSGLLEAVLTINESQRELLFRKLWRFFGGRMEGLRIAIWGAAFKPGTPSTENAVVHTLLSALWGQGCITAVHDPMAGESLRRQYPDQRLLEIAPDAMTAAQGADALVVVTEWDEYACPDFEALQHMLRQPAIFDGRNLYDPDYLRDRGFRYFAIGRGERI